MFFFLPTRKQLEITLIKNSAEPSLANKPKPVEASAPAAPQSSGSNTAATSLAERRAAQRERILQSRRVQKKRIQSDE